MTPPPITPLPTRVDVLEGKVRQLEVRYAQVMDRSAVAALEAGHTAPASVDTTAIDAATTQVTAYGTGTATANTYNSTIGVSATSVGQSSGQGYLAMYDSGASAMRYLTIHSGTVTVASSVPT